MKIRVRSIIVIVMSNLLIIIFSIMAGTLYARRNIEQYIETDMLVIADIANQYISAELGLLRVRVGNVAGGLSVLPASDWLEHLETMAAAYPQFIGMAVLGADGAVAVSQGELPADSGLADNEAFVRAFAGERVLSSTVPVNSGVVFYLFAPIPENDDNVVALTIPGQYFSELLSEYRIWETGHIFIDDSTGYILANTRRDWVENRHNFITAAQENPDYEQLAAIASKLINGERGVDYYTLDGNQRMCAYRPISGSIEGWALGVVAPSSESPQRDVESGFLIIGLVAFILSVTGAAIASNLIKKPFEQIEALMEKAEANSQAKSHFLANMSHEIRTPVNAIVGMATIGRETNDPSRKDYCYDKIGSASQHLLEVISDILDMSKIEADKIELSQTIFGIERLVREVENVFLYLIEEKQQSFLFSIESAIPKTLIGDPQRIKQVMSNLLSNAIKFTPEKGSISMDISLLDMSEDICTIKVSVTDTGIGISEEHQSVIFNPFQQAEIGTSRKYGGTGLGLSISKRIVEMMGGSISVLSSLGKGAVFSFVIKLRAADKQAILADRNADAVCINNMQTKGIFAGIHILLAEDVEINREIVQSLLEDTMLKIDCAENGVEAVRKFKESPTLYSLIFMDIQMPEMDGYEATRSIRSLDIPEADTVPIIAMTANVFREDIEKCIASGMDDHIGKPLDYGELMDKLHVFLRM